MTDGKALRFNTGKNRMGLIPARALQEVGRVQTKGAEKYGPNNWMRGMSWSGIVDSLERHLSAFKTGEDYDKETGLLHMAHVATNALYLTEYYSIYPHGDDRFRPDPWKIALDVDGVIAHFDKRYRAFCAERGVTLPDEPMYWNFHDKGLFKEIMHDQDFWMSIEPMVDPKAIPFEPVAYVTHRFIPGMTDDWLEMHGFPKAPVHTVDPSIKKTEVLATIDFDIFVDDKYQNFLDINSAHQNGEVKGMCFLYDAPYNRKYNVGAKRIHSLEQLS